MVESEAQILSEEAMLGAVVFGHEQMQIAIRNIRELAAEAGKPRWEWKAPDFEAPLAEAVAARCRGLAIGRLPHHREDSSARPVFPRSRRTWSPPWPRPTASRRSGSPRQWSTSCSSSRARSCASASWPGSRASTDAIRPPCDRSASRWACCRGRMVRRCSRAARPRRWWPPRSAPRAMRRSSMRSRASAANRSCCITTSRRSRWARPA